MIVPYDQQTAAAQADKRQKHEATTMYATNPPRRPPKGSARPSEMQRPRVPNDAWLLAGAPGQCPILG